ncbi:type II toxin-antitoxin system prevent-host-death family antitoxin [Litorisediminicola beolgyonensis]|uniref:Type II toxin-antitoxin system prevent-host-death family antitoxin n=1 Tax=Litorisediminicola beolgyonensis TaxID=1173614 RepID=A0ABW3ZLW3_9RHOB
MPIPKFEQVTATVLRARMSEHLRFVRETGGQVYITNHRRRIAALVPIWQADCMCDVEAWTVKEFRRRQDETMRAWRALRSNAGYVD